MYSFVLLLLLFSCAAGNGSFALAYDFMILHDIAIERAVRESLTYLAYARAYARATRGAHAF